jgi:hypothetical protein
MFNIALAAIDGKNGDPNDYRNYRLQTIMRENSRTKESRAVDKLIVNS